MSREVNIAVLVCTCNGEKYIGEQLDTIIQQSLRPAHIFVFDWNSSDDTVSIAEKTLSGVTIASTIIRKFDSPGVYSSFKQSLSEILASTAAFDFIALSDQDDIWECDKLETAAARLEHDHSVPQLFFSDVSIISAEGAMQRYSRARTSPYFTARTDNLNTAVFLATPAVGMTMVISRELAEAFTTLPDTDQFMHDWSILLCAIAIEAKIYFEPKALVLYRQHESNILGSESRESKVRLLAGMFSRMQKLEAQYLLFQQVYPDVFARPFYSRRLIAETAKASFLTLTYRAVLLAFLCAGSLMRKLSRIDSRTKQDRLGND